MATRQEQDNLVSWPFSCLLDIWHLNEKRGPPKSLSCCPHISHPQAQSLTHILIWCCSWCGYWHLHPYYNIHVYGECMHYYLLSNEDIHAVNDDDEDDISLLLRWSICQVLILFLSLIDQSHAFDCSTFLSSSAWRPYLYYEGKRWWPVDPSNHRIWTHIFNLAPNLGKKGRSDPNRWCSGLPILLVEFWSYTEQWPTWMCPFKTVAPHQWL